MGQTITIDPVTRIEGHARVRIQLDDAGAVQDARVQVTEFRGFERFTEGRPFYEMPSIMPRICGICPVSHLLASVKTCDRIMAVQVPETAINLRRLLNLAQLVQSHALSFFYLSSPDLLLGMDSDPALRNVVGVVQQAPEYALAGIWLRQFGQETIEDLAEKRVHPRWAVPGGVSRPLSSEQRDRIRAKIPEGIEITRRALEGYKGVLGKYKDEIETFSNFPSLFMGTVTPTGELEHTYGFLRIMDATGRVLADQIPTEKYQQYLGEAVEPWSYMKFPYYQALGYPDGVYRVGPAARLNVADRCGTPLADAELEDFRARYGRPALSSFHNHYARLIEILFGLERMGQLLDDPEILSPHVRVHALANNSEGIGCIEAPRGTLIHHYRVNEQGQITWANLIVATGHNNLAMNRGALQVAKQFVHGDHLTEGMLNRVEALIRAFDPCLSCATHELGRMALEVQLSGPDGRVLEVLQR